MTQALYSFFFNWTNGPTCSENILFGSKEDPNTVPYEVIWSKILKQGCWNKVSADMDSQPVGHYYILDPSALVYGGIGKIKEWVNSTVLNHKKGNESFRIVFYVPSYTLKELDFLRKVFNPLISANAHESIRFIDSQISGVQFDGDENDCDIDIDRLSLSEDDSDFGAMTEDKCEGDGIGSASPDVGSSGLDSAENSQNSRRKIDKTKRSESNDYTDFESYNKMKLVRNEAKASKKNSVKPVTFILESERNVGPDWKIASGYRRSTPLLSELPKPINGFSSRGQLVNDDGRNFAVGVFGNNIPGSFNVSAKNNNIHAANSNSATNPSYVGDSEKAIVPIRLKFLIRSCIQKQYIEGKFLKEDERITWNVICEDATTSIWLKNFGLKVKTLNNVQDDFDKFSGGLGAKVLFDPSSGKLVETSSAKFNRKNTNKKAGGAKNQRIKSKEGNSTAKLEENESTAKAITNTSTKTKVRRAKKTQKSAKIDSSSEIGSSKKHVVSADTYAERGQGELWTP